MIFPSQSAIVAGRSNRVFTPMQTGTMYRMYEYTLYITSAHCREQNRVSRAQSFPETALIGDNVRQGDTPRPECEAQFQARAVTTPPGGAIILT